MGIRVLRACRTVPALCFFLLLSAAPAMAQGTTALFFESQAGDYIGAGQTKTYTEADGTFTVTSSRTSVNVRIAGPSFSFWWDATFSAPGGILPGVYNTARRSSIHVLQRAVVQRIRSRLQHAHRSLRRARGRLRALPASTRLAVDFEQHCEDAAPGLFGAIRYNSTISSLSPFGGSYPSYDLDDSNTVARHRHVHRRPQLRNGGRRVRGDVRRGHVRQPDGDAGSRLHLCRLDGGLPRWTLDSRSTSTVPNGAARCSSSRHRRSRER